MNDIKLLLLFLLQLLLYFFVLVDINARYREKLVALVIDEAHWLKTWGECFRTIFLQLGDLRSIVSAEVKSNGFNGYFHQRNI